MPEAFTFSPGSSAAQEPALLDSLHLSLVTVAALGLGDIAPGESRLRLASPLEALVGFALLTATVSWVLEIYPALTRRRVLAIRLALLRDSDPALQQIDCTAGALLLNDLATEVVCVRIDFTQYAEAYYFHDGEDQSSLAAMVGYAATLAERGQAAGRPEVRLAGDLLAGALKDLAAILDQRFLHTGGTPADVFAWAHRRLGSGPPGMRTEDAESTLVCRSTGRGQGGLHGLAPARITTLEGDDHDHCPGDHARWCHLHPGERDAGSRCTQDAGTGRRSPPDLRRGRPASRDHHGP
ncbi:ion channel [Streptomyces chartreusis]|uniref:ion channel n=1 Tax=Streptomyces chartreusis TaxID=1969 RepID=UPI00362C7DB6